ncbi:DUF72 domain-containing protein [soil metagenome]
MSSILIGTSGYTYSWNKGKSTKFEWDINQGFNSVEINGSFYRFPTESWTNNWKKASGDKFMFSIKVHRSITHYTRLKGNKSIKLWKRFKKSVEPIEDKVVFWLFQMPSTFKFNQEKAERLRIFANKAELNKKAVIEFHDSSWWSKAALKELEKIKFSLCSVDAPLLPKKILNLNNIIYLRLHGSTSWYNYVYSEKELKRIINKLQKKHANKKAVYLNNDHGMLPNGKFLMDHLLNTNK